MRRIAKIAEELEPEDVKCAEIKRMYVRERFRGRGVAARLYERNGYQRCARYNLNPQAAIFMRKKLRTDF